jgi:hypothetical protein
MLDIRQKFKSKIFFESDAIIKKFKFVSPVRRAGVNKFLVNYMTVIFNNRGMIIVLSLAQSGGVTGVKNFQSSDNIESTIISNFREDSTLYFTSAEGSYRIRAFLRDSMGLSR